MVDTILEIRLADTVNAALGLSVAPGEESSIRRGK